MLLRRAQASTINSKEYDSLPSSTYKFKIIQIPLDLDVHPLAHDSSNAENSSRTRASNYLKYKKAAAPRLNFHLRAGPFHHLNKHSTVVEHFFTFNTLEFVQQFFNGKLLLFDAPCFKNDLTFIHHN